MEVQGGSMIDRITLRLWNPQQAHQAITAQLWPHIKAALMAGHRMALELRPETRSGAENRLLHSLLGQISQTQEWAGKKRDVETWKRLLTAAWCRAIGEQVELLPALDGHGVDIVFRKTSTLTRKECADLIEFIFAWAAQNGIHFPQRVDQETGEIL